MPATTWIWVAIASVGVVLFLDSVFIVRQQRAVVLERLGKFQSVRFAGLNFKLPIIDRRVGTQNLRIQQLDVDVETKTLDNVFIDCKVSVQYQVVRDKVKASFLQPG